MAEKNFSTRIINKHDTEANWSKATNFIPKQGELIIYDADENNTKIRFKIGDGSTAVNTLPFVIDGIAADWNQNDEAALNYIQNRTHWEEGTYVLPETKVDIKSIYRKNLSLQDTINFVDGNVYDIVYNGKTYSVPTKFATDYYHFETVDFHITVANEYKVLQIMAYDGSSTVTLSISENVDGVSTELFPETTTTLSAIGARAGILPEHLTDKIVVGETYNIHYNGFSCDVVAISNSTQIQLLDPEDTFAIYIDTTEVQLPQITVLSGVTEANISIFSGEIHKLDNKYIDQKIVTKEIEKLNLQNGEAFGSVRNKISMAESNNYKLGTGAMALGSSSKATGPSGVSMGTATNAMGAYSVAIGNGSVASGNQSFAGGAMTEAIGFQSVAIGENVAATGVDSVAFGRGNRISITVSGDANATTYNCSNVSQLAEKMCVIYNDVRAWINAVDTSNGTITLDRTLSSTALTNASVNVITSGSFSNCSFSGGQGNRVVGDRSFAYGNGAIVSGADSAAIGNMVEASGYASFAVGNNNKATNAMTAAFGNSNTVSGYASFAAGASNTLSGPEAFVAGSGNTVSSSQGFAAGYQNNISASGAGSASFGFNNTVSGSQSAAVGIGHRVTGSHSFAAGVNNIASGQGSAAIGSEIVAIGDFSFAEGGNLDSTNDKNRILSLTITGDANATTYTCTSVTNLTTNHYVFIGSKFAKITSIDTTNRTITLENTLSNTALSSVEAKAAKYGAFGKYSHSGGSKSVATGEDAFAHGMNALAAGNHSISIGSGTQATGLGSIAFGGGATASGEHSFSAGGGVTASGNHSVALGGGTQATGQASFAMGSGARATGQASFSVGSGTVAEGVQSVAFGGGTTASGVQSFAHGSGARATGYASFSMGAGTLAEGSESVAFGASSRAFGIFSFAHGGSALAAGQFSFAHGSCSHTTTTITGNANATTYTCSSVSGISSGYYVVYNSTVAKVTSVNTTNKTITLEKTLSSSALSNVNVVAGSSGALSQFSHASGAGSLTTGDFAFAHGNGAKATGVNSTAFGNYTTASGEYSVAMGNSSSATGYASVTFGTGNTASGHGAFAMGGGGATASGSTSFAHGSGAQATAPNAFAHGIGALASAPNAIAMGENAQSVSLSTVALGNGAKATAPNAFAMGENTQALGYSSFAAGYNRLALNSGSISMGYGSSFTNILITGEANSTSYTYSSNSSYIDGLYVILKSSNSYAKIIRIDSANKVLTLDQTLSSSALINAEAFTIYNGALSSYSISISNSIAAGSSSLAAGDRCIASGYASIALGLSNTVSGYASFAAGNNNNVTGSYGSAAIGDNNTTEQSCSIALGNNNKAIGYSSFAAGGWNTASGQGSVALGINNTASGNYSFATGNYTKAFGNTSFSAGQDSKAYGSDSFVAGTYSVAAGHASVAMGRYAIAIGNHSHAEGYSSGYVSEVFLTGEADATTYTVKGSCYEDEYIICRGKIAKILSVENDQIVVDKSLFWKALENEKAYISRYGAFGEGSHVEGSGTITMGGYSHAEGMNTIAYGDYSHAEGQDTKADSYGAHVEGYYSVAMGSYSHAEGNHTFAFGQNAHAEGSGSWAILRIMINGEANATTYTYVKDGYSNDNLYSGQYICWNDTFVKIVSTTSTQFTVEKTLSSYAIVNGYAYATSCGAFGLDSHIEGYYTTTFGLNSHAEGSNTIASGENQHVQGKYNIEDTENKYAHIVGNGEGSNQRSNAHTLDWEGNSWYQSSVRVGGTDQEAAPTTLAANGLILTDETTGTKYRIFVTNAKLTMEVVEE